MIATARALDGSWPALGQAGPALKEGFEVLPLLFGLLGGLALFLYGLEQMTRALKSLAGDRMKAILARLTANRFLGVVTGAFVTVVIQSSSVTTVLVVGFITAGMMSLAQSVGVIMGANIGTTVTAQIVAFNVTRYALVLIAVGFGMLFFAKKTRRKQQGHGIMGIGLVFFGMKVMGDAMEPLRGYQPFLEWMVAMEKPLLGILAGAVFTALVQSSSAATGVVIVMATQGFISLPAGIALSFGCNIGTCVTALLASIGKPREALRAAAVHVLFNVLGVLAWIAFIDQLAQLVVWLSPVATGLEGADKLAAETPRQIANAHTIFNIANTLIFIGFTTQLARLVERLFPDRPQVEGDTVRARYLDAELLPTPSLALDRARLEILHMGERVTEMMRAILPAMLRGSRESLRAVEEMDDPVDVLHGYIITYLGKISQAALTEAETQELIVLMEATNSLENVGDVIETNLVTLGRQRIEDNVYMSEPTMRVIGNFHSAVSRAFDEALLAVTQRNHRAARLVLSMKTDINRLASSASRHQAERLVAAAPNRLRAYSVEVDMLANLRRVYFFARRMARAAGQSAAAMEKE